MKQKYTSKDDYQAYREAAQAMYRETEVRVGPHSTVHMTFDGAFVEALVWVPMEKIRNAPDGSQPPTV